MANKTKNLTRSTPAVLCTTMASAPVLTEDTIDDILFFARTAELQDLQRMISEFSSNSGSSEQDVVAAAIDHGTQNTALHMAAANGHSGTLYITKTQRETTVLTNSLQKS